MNILKLIALIVRWIAIVVIITILLWGCVTSDPVYQCTIPEQFNHSAMARSLYYWAMADHYQHRSDSVWVTIDTLHIVQGDYDKAWLIEKWQTRAIYYLEMQQYWMDEDLKRVFLELDPQMREWFIKTQVRDSAWIHKFLNWQKQK